MGCCESKKEVVIGLNSSNKISMVNSPIKPLKLSDYNEVDLNQ